MGYFTECQQLSGVVDHPVVRRILCIVMVDQYIVFFAKGELVETPLWEIAYCSVFWWLNDLPFSMWHSCAFALCSMKNK